MSAQGPEMTPEMQAPQAKVQTRRGFSIIWVVPIVALLIGGWLAYKAMSERGPTITISFATAEGLEAGKTMIKFKDVAIGKVTDIELKRDLSGVFVTAEMQNDAEPFMTENTRFWVVRARVAAGEVSGLGTLFSGAYIGCSPSTEGKRQTRFIGLEKPPILTEGQPGRHFILEAKSLGSLDLGSPVYYRGIKVGQIVGYEFDEQAETVQIKAFVNAPYHEKVLQNSRFWNASGIDFTMDATGLKLDTQSLVSIMLGGVAFDLRQYEQPKPPAGENHKFRLYPNHESSKEEVYTIRRYFEMYFDQSVRGLTPGAPVEIMGIQIGEVVDIQLQYDMKRASFHIPVRVAFEPERLPALINEEGEILIGAEKSAEISQEEEQSVGILLQRMQKLIDRGLRARLKTGNLLTGQLFVDLAYYPDAPPARIEMGAEYPVFPTVSSSIEDIVEKVDKILEKVEKIPFGEIGQELQAAIRNLNSLLGEVKSVSGTVNRETLPKINEALDELQQTLQGIGTTLGPDAALSYNARKATEELTLAIRSIRLLVEYLERNPQALIFGKEEKK